MLNGIIFVFTFLPLIWKYGLLELIISGSTPVIKAFGLPNCDIHDIQATVLVLEVDD